jgi:hypothetical protein
MLAHLGVVLWCDFVCSDQECLAIIVMVYIVIIKYLTLSAEDHDRILLV